jgi:release factor glutamine methyltransferase
MWHPRMSPATAQMWGPCKEAGARADAASVPADTLAGLSVEVARRHLARAFRERNIDTPEVDARIIVGHALGLDHAALVAQSGRVLVPPEADAIAALAARRCAHEPVARILGCKEFWGLPLRVNAETLLPRPETETVVEAALAALEGRHRTSDPLRIVDLGTGSGALLLALLSELPNAGGVGTDISVGALGCARANAAALGLSDRAAFVA